MAHLPAASLNVWGAWWVARASYLAARTRRCPLEAVRALLLEAARQAPAWPRATEQERQHTEGRLTRLAMAYQAAGGDWQAVLP